MKHDWVVENDDAKKALHDLYFETGSLPDQQPKVKAKEAEKPKTQDSLSSAVSSPAIESAQAGRPLDLAPSRSAWVKRAGMAVAALALTFITYRAWPNFQATPPAATSRHTKSAMIQATLAKTQNSTPTPSLMPSLTASGTLDVGPSLIMVPYEPGMTTSQTLKIDNQTPKALTFELEAMDLVVRGNQPATVPAGDTPNSVAATAIFSQRYVRVESMESQTVQVSLSMVVGTTVRGVLIRLRGMDNLSAKGAGTFSASLGTLIALDRGQSSQLQNSPATAAQDGGTRLVVSQWAMENNTSTPGADSHVALPGSSSLKSTNVAALRQ